MKLEQQHKQELKDGSYITAQKKVQAAYKKQQQDTILHSILDQHEKLIQPNHHVSLQNDEFNQTMQARNQAIHTSLKNPLPTTQYYTLTAQAMGYLQSQNIDPQIFMTTHGIDIQHQFTKELILITDSVARSALHYAPTSLHNQLATHCMKLASLTQESNQVENLINLEQGVNCCHGIDQFIHAISTNNMSIADQYITQALHYCTAIARGVLQGTATAVAISAATNIGIALAPTPTGIILNTIAVATAIHIGTLCGQGLMHACTLGNYYIHGDYDRVDEYLQKTYQSLTNLDNIEHAAAYASGYMTAYKGLPALHKFQQLFDIRPVITTVEQASGQMSRSLWFLTAAQIEEEFIAAQQLLQRPEFKNFNITCQELLGFKIFNLRPPSDPKLTPLLQLADMHALIGPKDQVTLGQIFMNSTTQKNIQGAIASVFSGTDSEFFTTEIGKKMYRALTKPHEQIKLNNIAKDYQKLKNNNAPEHELNAFYKSCEVLITALETQSRSDFIDIKYPGIHDHPDHPYLSMHVQHIFYPEIKAILNDTNNGIQEFRLEGFHHDQYGILEKSGLFTYINPIYGDAEYGAEECIAAYVDFRNGIQPITFKTFFPQSWSQEKTINIIFQAAQNIIKFINEKNSKILYECQGPHNMIIDIILDKKNCITTAYPSIKNFKGLS